MATDIKPIETEAQHRAALKEIERLWHAKKGTPDADRMKVLSILVDAYETEHFPLDPPDAIDAILFRLEQLGLDRKALEPLLGSRSRVSEVLSRKRNMSIEMIRRLSDELHISPDVLIKPTRNVTPRRLAPTKIHARTKIARSKKANEVKSSLRSGRT
jgi:HTH-type transcriptional regulator / antitoxin HigA